MPYIGNNAIGGGLIAGFLCTPILNFIQVGFKQNNNQEITIFSIGQKESISQKKSSNSYTLRLHSHSFALTLSNKEGFLEVENGVVRVEVVGTLDGLQHEQDLVFADEDFEGEEVRLDLAGGERLQRPQEVTRHLQRVGRLKGEWGGGG